MSKIISTAALNILSSSQYYLAELYQFTLYTGAAYYFTSGQVPITTAIATGPTTFGATNTYATGLVLIRGDISQKIGVEGGSMKLTVIPATPPNIPGYPANGPALINGYPFLEACHMGLLDGSTVQVSKFVATPPVPPAQMVTSQGAFGYYMGTVENMEVGRFKAELTVDDYLVYMNNQQMPRNVYMSGCMHRFLDHGCDPSGTVRTASTVTGATISAVTNAGSFTTSLTQADHYFDLGYMTFTSGVNNTFIGTISQQLHASGALVLKYPMPAAPSPGDTFNIVRGCDLSVASCNARSNLAHNSSVPFMPVPETILDGGTETPPAQNVGGQAGQIIGSGPGYGAVFGKYKT